MTPFDINPDNDAGHAIDQDDLIAFHLHDLPSPQERAVHRALRTNPTLQAESLAIASTLRAFPKHEPSLPLTAAALDHHWQALRTSLTPYVPAPAAPFSFFNLQALRWAIPTLAGAAIIATAIILSLHHNPRTPPTNLASNQPYTAAAPNAPASTFAPSNPASSSNPSTPFLALSSTPHTPSLTSTAAQPRATAAPTSPNPAPTTPTLTASTPQPPNPSPSATANTNLATTQQPQSSPTPAFTPIIETRGHTRTHHDHTTEITFAALGNFTPNRSFTSTTGTGASAITTPYAQTATPTVGVLASFHQQLRPWLGYRITATHSEPTFEYTSTSANSTGGIIVPENAYEVSAAYVVQGPRHRHVSTSAEAGGGVLAFHPTNPNSILGVTNTLRSVAVLGVSAELALTKHFALHAGYRALLYKSPPAYITENFTAPPSGNFTLSNEPVIGLTYRFHEARE